MMNKAKKKQKPAGTNMRLLSIAYATGRITREAYLNERTRQIGALEFGKPLPELPEELYDINVPTEKIDASYINAKRLSHGRHKIIAIIVVLIVLVGGGAGVWFSGILAPKAAEPTQTSQPKLSDYADKLLHSGDWTERDIMAFLRVWAVQSTNARERARTTAWYRQLDNEIIKRINQARLKEQSSGELLPGEKRHLDLLRAFQAQLSSN